MAEYFVYFPFSKLKSGGKRSVEARSSYCAVLPQFTDSFSKIYAVWMVNFTDGAYTTFRVSARRSLIN